MNQIMSIMFEIHFKAVLQNIHTPAYNKKYNII